jgi:hypothetical protein
MVPQRRVEFFSLHVSFVASSKMILYNINCVHQYYFIYVNFDCYCVICPRIHFTNCPFSSVEPVASPLGVPSCVTVNAPMRSSQCTEGSSEGLRGRIWPRYSPRDPPPRKWERVRVHGHSQCGTRLPTFPWDQTSITSSRLTRIRVWGSRVKIVHRT